MPPRHQSFGPVISSCNDLCAFLFVCMAVATLLCELSCFVNSFCHVMVNIFAREASYLRLCICHFLLAILSARFRILAYCLLDFVLCVAFRLRLVALLASWLVLSYQICDIMASWVLRWFSFPPLVFLVCPIPRLLRCLGLSHPIRPVFVTCSCHGRYALPPSWMLALSWHLICSHAHPLCPPLSWAQLLLQPCCRPPLFLSV